MRVEVGRGGSVGDIEGRDEGGGFDAMFVVDEAEIDEEEVFEEEEDRGMKPPRMPTRMIWSTVEARWSILVQQTRWRRIVSFACGSDRSGMESIPIINPIQPPFDPLILLVPLQTFFKHLLQLIHSHAQLV
jgi:hypothetical protein